MISRATTQLSPLEFKQSFPKVASEDRVSVTDNRPRHPVETKDLFDEDMGNSRSCVGMGHGHKVGVFGETIDLHHNGILVSRERETIYEIHRDIYPDILWNR